MAETTEKNSNASWLEIWKRKGKSDTAMTEPLHHASGLCQLTEDQYEFMIRTILTSYSYPVEDAPEGEKTDQTATIVELLKPDDAVMEFGCGGGGFLSMVNKITSHQQLRISGVDYSPSLIDIAKARVAGGTFGVQDVTNIREFQPENNVYDATMSFGVLLYLSTVDQAYKALSEMVRVTKPGGYLVIPDVSDLERQHIDQKTREESDYYQSDSYKKHGGDTPKHLFLPKSFFHESADKLGFTIYQIVDEHTLPGITQHYHPAKWRYTVFAKKNASSATEVPK